jgi:isopentenyl-diphosphate Delta-isomerase
MSENMSEIIVLVDEKDHPIGYEEKMKAHSDGGKLHRAFSIFIYNSNNQMLLQLRSNAKHHFQSLWSNGCCSHPLKGEELEKAAHRKLKQEFGFDTKLKEVFSFVYRADDPKSGLTEHEFDHVFIGEYNGVPKPNPEEIDDWKWVSPTELKNDLTENPDHYTPWLKPAFDGLVQRNGIKL